MYRKLLVLLDGSELAEVVFPFAEELAARLDLEVILLLAGGYFAEEILRYAEENEIDLMMMASHGRSGIRRWHMGGVADKVLRASKVPVWFVHAGIPDAVPYNKWPSKTFIVPLDGSERSESVLPHVETLARQRTIEPVNITLLRICDPPIAPSYYSPELSGVPLNWGEFMEQEMTRGKQAAFEYLSDLKERLKDTGANITTEILVGKAGDEIIEYAAKNPYSVIVMTTHGRSGLSRLVYGSVAESVLMGVSNPTLVIKPGQSE